MKVLHTNNSIATRSNFLFSLILSIASFAILISCKDDDNKHASSLEGKWNVVSLEIYDCPDVADNSLKECGTASICGTWEFKTDGSYVINYTNGNVYNATYVKVGASEVQLCYSNACGGYNYSFSGNTMIFTEIPASPGECITKYTFVKS